MNTSHKFALGLGLGLVAFSVNAASSSANLDTFDSFAANYLTTGAGGANGGFILGIAGAGGSMGDGSASPATHEPVVTDSSFAGLTRRVLLTGTAGTTGTSDVYNGTVGAGPTYTPTGSLAYLNGNKQSTLALSYTLASASDLSAYTQINLNFLNAEAAFNLVVDITSSVGAEGTLTRTLAITPSFVSYTLPITLASLTGNPLVWDSVKTIKFTLNNGGSSFFAPNLFAANNQADLNLDSIGFSNPNVPEAATTVPAVAFAMGVGFFAWKRRSAK
jgi:hypothetical protein